MDIINNCARNMKASADYLFIPNLAKQRKCLSVGSMVRLKIHSHKGVSVVQPWWLWCVIAASPCLQEVPVARDRLPRMGVREGGSEG